MTYEDMFDDMDKDTLIKDIDAFHKKFGFEKNNTVSIPENNELVNFRTSFLLEELTEYTQAITKKDTAAALDALVDIVYIALGTAWLFNLPFEKAWQEVQRANMSKVRTKSKSKKRGTSFDVVKPKNWRPPDIDQVIYEEREKQKDDENTDNRF
jgi:predicted HAD superfamily Cof-like phosphohydrolase